MLHPDQITLVLFKKKRENKKITINLVKKENRTKYKLESRISTNQDRGANFGLAVGPALVRRRSAWPDRQTGNTQHCNNRQQPITHQARLEARSERTSTRGAAAHEKGAKGRARRPRTNRSTACRARRLASTATHAQSQSSRRTRLPRPLLWLCSPPSPS